MSQESYVEKVSVNINTASLSSIDLLVDNGYYSNRSDFINQAVRSELEKQRTTTDRIIRRNEREAEDEYGWFIGVSGITARMIEDSHRKGESMDMKGYGLLIIHEDCDEDKLYQVIKTIRVRGRVMASDAVKRHYGLK